jgi:hypothetical protein
MKLSQKFRTWASRRGALAIFCVVVILLGVYQIWDQRTQPHISHVLGSSTQHVDMLWVKQEIFRQTATEF